MISLTFSGSDSALVERFARKASVITSALAVKLQALNYRLQAKIQGEKLQGQVLNQRTGKGAASVRALDVEKTPGEIRGSVQAGGGPAFYMRTQEKGGTSEYTIQPVNKQVLAFMLNGKQVFAKMVHHPPLKARPFMSTSLDEMTPEIIEGLQVTLNESASLQ